MTTTRIDSLNLGEERIALLRNEDLYSDCLLEACSPDDVAALPIGLRVKLRGAFPNLTAAIPDHRKVARAGDVGDLVSAGNPLIDGIDDQVNAQKVILERIASGDRSPAIRKAARKLGIEALAREDGKVNMDATTSYLAHLDDGGTRRTTWQDCEVVPIDVAFTKLRYNPITKRELEDGVDPRSGINYGDLSDETIAQIAFAVGDGMVDGMSEATIVMMLNGGDEELIKRVMRRMKSQKADSEGLLRGLRNRAVLQPVPSRREPREQPKQESGYRGTWPSALDELLKRSFGWDELRRFAGRQAAGSCQNDLPTSCSLNELSYSLISVWQQRGLINRDLALLLIDERPRRRDEIVAVFAGLGVIV